MLHWNDEKSITLTKYFVLGIAAACAVAVIRGPWIVSWIMHNRHLALNGPAVGAVLLGSGYLSAALAFWMLYNLYRFLLRLENREVFVADNVTALRRISWCCALAALLCLPVGVLIYLPFFFLGAAAGFMALIVRVLKNAFEQAVRMKTELDYTI